MQRPELVIFDCDGTLVDSERIAVSVDQRMFADLGWQLTEAEVIERFVGLAGADARALVEARIGRLLDDDWHAPYIPWFREAFERDLQLVDGVADLLDGLALPTCIGSNTSRDGIDFRLRLTGIDHHFPGDRVFSAEDVTHGKPAPDLFLHAARTLGAEPSRCVVIEDSPAGVAAGIAAGMRVFAFRGTVVPLSRFPEGTTWFEHMRELPGLLGFSPEPAP